MASSRSPSLTRWAPFTSVTAPWRFVINICHGKSFVETFTDMKPILNARNLAQLYRLCAEHYGELPAFATCQTATSWQPISFRELYERGKLIAAGLAQLGVRQGDPVGLISDNRVEWMLAEVGIQLAGAVNTPRGTDVIDDEWAYIFEHAEIEVAFVEGPKELQRLTRLRVQWPNLREVIQLDTRKGVEAGVHTLDQLAELGASALKTNPQCIQEREQSVSGDDLFTLIYTSGTTGKPKGVMLTHENILSQIRNVPLELSCTDRVLSILPIWHVFERMFEVFTMSYGVCTYYTSLRTLGQDLQNVEPTFMGSAPRLWESLHHRIMQGIGQAHPVRRALFHIAYRLSSWYQQSWTVLRNETLEPPPRSLIVRLAWKMVHGSRICLILPLYGFFNAAVLENVRLKAGGCLKATISGGGALPMAIDQFYRKIGIHVLEGYGLTETSPVLAVRIQRKEVAGTVGPIIPQTELRIVHLETDEILYSSSQPALSRGTGLRGEIHVRGPQIMRGYYKEHGLTREVLSEDGWFRTGDIGMVTWNGCLRILGRCKSTIVLSNGENIEPEPIEARLRQCAHIENLALMGQDCKHLYALVVPDLEQFQQDGREVKTREELITDPEVHQMIFREIREMQHHPSDSGKHPSIRAIRLIAEPFTPGEELTNLFKLKRHVVAQKYDDVLQSLYATEEPDSSRSRGHR